jgi:hypothetical protein
MISADVSKTLESLKKAHAEIVRRMENMVRGFAYEFAMTAISNTPLGDDIKYESLYKARTYLQPEAGFAQGSWQVSYTGSLQMQDVYSGSEALSIVKSKMQSYKLGQSFTIGNTGPYINMLENGYSDQAPTGIVRPTVDQVMNAYKINLLRYYKQ